MSDLERRIIAELKTASPLKSYEPASEIERRSKNLNVNGDEIDAALDAIENRLFSFAVPISKAQPPKLLVNQNTRLSEDEKLVAEKLIAGFEERLRTGEIAFTKTRDSLIIPFPEEAEATIANATEGSIILPSSESAIAPANEASFLNCTWRWCFKKKWYGLRLRLNHCAVQYITYGGSIAALNVPPPFNVALATMVAILKLFDTGCGVQIHVSWIGTIWIVPKSCSKCN